VATPQPRLADPAAANPALPNANPPAVAGVGGATDRAATIDTTTAFVPVVEGFGEGINWALAAAVPDDTDGVTIAGTALFPLTREKRIT
jgi:hypothetical protein